MEIKNIDELKQVGELLNGADTPRIRFINRMWYFIGRDKKINAIKEYRKASGRELRDCKFYVDSLFDNQPTGYEE